MQDALRLLKQTLGDYLRHPQTSLVEAGLSDWNLVMLITEWEEITAQRISQRALASCKTVHDLLRLLQVSDDVFN